MRNLVILSGNVGQDPEVRYNDNHSVVASFSLATTDSWKDRAGEWKEKTSWHAITAWGDLAKKVEVLVKKGMRLSVTGKLQNDVWSDKEQKKHTKTYVAISEFEILMAQPKREEIDNLSSM